MFGFMKKKPLSPHLQKVYDQEYRVQLDSLQRTQQKNQAEQVRLQAQRDAQARMTPASTKFIRGVASVGKTTAKVINKFPDSAKVEAFVVGDKKKR
jgi:hypothetical protein